MGLSSLTGIEPWPPALGAQSLSHWTTREVPINSNLLIFRQPGLLLPKKKKKNPIYPNSLPCLFEMVSQNYLRYCVPNLSPQFCLLNETQVPTFRLGIFFQLTISTLFNFCLLLLYSFLENILFFNSMTILNKFIL